MRIAVEQHDCFVRSHLVQMFFEQYFHSVPSCLSRPVRGNAILNRKLLDADRADEIVGFDGQNRTGPGRRGHPAKWETSEFA
jgi:hypothetical protein